MRTSVLFALVCTFVLVLATAPALVAQVDDTRETAPGVQPDTGYSTQQSQTDGVTGTGTDGTEMAADGTSWAATIVAFLAGLGLGWVIFRRPARRGDMIDRDRRAA